MRETKNQVWVTSVLSNEDVPKALVLSTSLRRTVTTRKIFAIVTSGISDDLRTKLDHGFDFVMYLNEENIPSQLSIENFAKVYLFLSLRSFEKCAYLSPTMMALANCDDIFDETVEELGLLENPEDTSLFLFKPSRQYYHSLLNWFESESTKGFSNKLNLSKWATFQQIKPMFINKKFKHVYKIGETLLANEAEMCLINMLDYPNDSNISVMGNDGFLGMTIASYWRKIHQHVLPLTNCIFEDTDNKRDHSRGFKEAIAVVGMSCRYPGSGNIQEFWNVLYHGEDATGSPPPFRWLKEQGLKQSSGAKSTNAGFLTVPVDEFDAKFFGISPKEATFMDPQYRLLHELVWEGLEDACIDPHTLRGTSGSIFMGSWLNEYKDIILNSGNSEFYRTYMGNSIGAAAARISFMLGTTGPSIATESGCSSAMVALHLACRALQNGETNLALACGVNLLLYPFNQDVMPMVVSPDGHCKTFSEDANGFARAEGGGVLVLKRLSDALKNGDHVWGLVRGSALAQEGVSKSMGTPTIYCESRAMKEALRDARVLPEDISYVEAHGTGTIVGDPMEVAAIAKAYHSCKRLQPLVIGSVKTNVGHTESCSGITSIMKVLLAMKHKTIPAHRNFKNLNPSIDLNAIPAIIPMERMEWSRINGRTRIAGVSSFGITGTDVHIIIEEFQAFQSTNKLLAIESNLERPLHLLKLSAKTEEALNSLLEKYKKHTDTCHDSISDIAYSANVGRANFPLRAAITARSNTDVSEVIEKRKYIQGESSLLSDSKICFLFTGQGCQFKGMAETLYKTSPVFRMYFDQCDKILKNAFQINITDVLWSINVGSVNEITKTIYSQISIFCIEYALLKLWESWGVVPDYVLGHSLGEYCAAVCAGVLTLEEAITLVEKRSQLIDKLPHGKMLVIHSNLQQVDTALKQFAKNDDINLLDCAAENSENQTVVSGDPKTILEFSQFCVNNNIKCSLLQTTHAFHSRHMDSMLDEFGVIAEETIGTQLRAQNCRYISGMKGDVIPFEILKAEYWKEHTREKVNFLTASQKAVKMGCKVFIEIGPQPVLSALTMANANIQVLCLPSLKRNQDDWQTLLNSLGKIYAAGYDIDWNGVDQFYSRRKVQLPHYPFKGKKYGVDTVRSSGNMIHPLIGSVIQNASHINIFQCAFNLQNHKYMKDHLVGETILFPGSGFLEMCLAAGFATVDGSTEYLSYPTRPMKVENLLIKAPLALQESNVCQLQTIVELDQSSVTEYDFVVKISRKIESENEIKWLEHVSAKYSPVPNEEDQVYEYDKETFLQTITDSSETDSFTELYEKLCTVGLKFGPSFKSLEKLWKCKNGAIVVKIKTPPVDEVETQSIIHPVILDAMIQSIMLPKVTKSSKVKLFVPLRVGKFVWNSKGSSTQLDRYVYINHNREANDHDNSESALLLDSNGHIIAVMSDIDLIESTVKSIQSVLEQQINPFPQMWEEKWRNQIGPLECPHDTELCNTSRSSLDELHEHVVEIYDMVAPHIETTLCQLDTLSYYYILRCLYKCGFKPTLGVPENELRNKLHIKDEYMKLFSYYMRVLEEENIIQHIDSNQWKLTKMPPASQEIEDELVSPSFTVDLVNSFKCAHLFIKVGENLSEILQGTKSALGILFPDKAGETGSSSVPEFYKEYTDFTKMADLVNVLAKASYSHCKTHAAGKRQVLRICEVGAGTGSLTGAVLQNLESLEIEYEYTYTDISPAFFAAAEKKFRNFAKNIIYKKLNIEEDPLDQGFIPEYYDLIYAADVVHATRNVKEALENVRVLLKPGGRLQLCETTRVARYLTYIFGLLDGFWRFDDGIRHQHCSLSIEEWTNTLALTGFQLIKAFPSVNKRHTTFWTSKTFQNVFPFKSPTENKRESKTKTWIVFHHEESLTSKSLIKYFAKLAYREVIVVHRGTNCQLSNNMCSLQINIQKNEEHEFLAIMKHIENCEKILEGVIYCWSLDNKCRDQDSILKPFFYLVKSLLAFPVKQGVKLCVLTNKVATYQHKDLSDYSKATIWGFIKTLQNERSDLKCRCIDIGDNEDHRISLQIFYEVWRDSKEVQVAYHNTKRCVPKLVPVKPALLDLKLPDGSGRFQLALHETRSISELKFEHLEYSNLKSKEVEIQVKASALNFKDVLNVLKPSDDFKDSNAVGFDFAGKITKVHPAVSKWKKGDYVFGVNTNGNALPSHVCIHEDDVIQVPDKMTLTEACTLPAVVITSYYCLIDAAKIKSTDTVLIHAASGGVGLSAIQICKHIGATVYATAGCKRKQNYLRSLGINNIFNSRTTDFGNQILEATNGRGVDVVLNSLTSEGFKEATLKACAYGARFVEMSKLSVWTTSQVKNLRPDIEYRTVDLSTMEKSKWNHYCLKLKELIENDIIRPIPHTRFNAVNIREALQFLQKAKHIGKVVVVMPEVKCCKDGAKFFTPVFNRRSTYLITGGLGGVGFEVCKWMINSGAKYIILAGRNPPTVEMARQIAEINLTNDSKVHTVQLDVANFDQCRELVEYKIEKMGYPTMRGIMHAAGSLHDGLIENQTWTTLSKTFDSKVYGTYNLHELTKNNVQMEHFVLFSSMASLFGSPGQSNHSAGNQFEDGIAHYRYSIGLPATSINWGQWGEVGVATELDIPGLKPISTLQGLTSLEYSLKSQRIQTAVIRVESFTIVSKLYPQISSIVNEIAGDITEGSSPDLVTLRSDDYWKQYDKLPCLSEKIEHLKNIVRHILRKILRLDETDAFEDSAEFQEMGVDSLMFVEIKNCLQALFGDRLTLSVNTLKDCTTIQLLAEKLVRVIEGNGHETQTRRLPTPEEVAMLIREDCVLHENVRAQPEQQRIKVEEISSILLTGVTGKLGPYVLKELCNYPKIKQIFCLIRPTKHQSINERLLQALKGMDMPSETDMQKIHCLQGNVAEIMLGLEPPTWEGLCDKIDAVFHCAAYVDHLSEYRKNDAPNSLRAVNIGGLKNILKFCCTGIKIKHLYNASTMLAVTTLDTNGNISEDWPEPNDFDNITHFAYPITKFVAEVVMKEAVKNRGIPGKSFRFPLLSGDSKTGKFTSLDNNHIMLRYIFILKYGMMTSNPSPVMMLPVDICAKISVSIFLNSYAPNEIYNLPNFTPAIDQDFISIAERLGHSVRLVELEEFLKKVQETSKQEGSPLAIFQEFYNQGEFEENMMTLYNTAPALKQWLLEGSASKDFFMSNKISNFFPEFYKDEIFQKSAMEYLYNDLIYAKQSGMLKEFGL